MEACNLCESKIYMYNLQGCENEKSQYTVQLSLSGIGGYYIVIEIFTAKEDNIFKDGICEKLQSIPYGDILKIEVWTKWQSRLLIGDNKKLFLNGNG